MLPTRAPRTRVETLPLLGSGRDQPLVTSQLAPKGRSRARGARGDRREAAPESRGRKRSDRSARSDRNARSGSDAQHGDRSGVARDRRRGDRDARSRDGHPGDSRRGDRRGKVRDLQREGEARAASSRDKRSKKRNVRNRQERPKPPLTPKAPRLRPGQKNRRAALAEMPEIQQGLAEEVLKGGVPVCAKRSSG